MQKPAENHAARGNDPLPDHAVRMKPPVLTKWKMVLLACLVFLLNTAFYCDDFGAGPDGPEMLTVIIENRSESNVYFVISFPYFPQDYETIQPENNFAVVHPHDTVHVDLLHGKYDMKRDFKKHKKVVFLISQETMDRYTWEEIKRDNLYDQKVYIGLNQFLEHNDTYTVVYAKK